MFIVQNKGEIKEKNHLLKNHDSSVSIFFDLVDVCLLEETATKSSHQNHLSPSSSLSSKFWVIRIIIIISLGSVCEKSPL